ncbi:MAG: PAS domain S-box protein [Bacteroidota bacterium]
MNELCRNIFESAPHPCICHKVIPGDEGIPESFEFILSNSAYDHLFGTSTSKNSGIIVSEHQHKQFDWFAFRKSLWADDKQISADVYFPALNKFMQLTGYRLDKENIVTWFTDLEMNKTGELSYRTSHQLSLLFDNMPGIAVQGYDINRRVIFWNQASEELYGYSAEEAYGRDLLDLIIPEEMHLKVAANIDEKVRTGEGGTAEMLNLKHKDGHLCPVLSHHTVIEYPPGEKCLYCIDVDMTPYEKVEEDIRKLSRTVEQSPVSIVITDTEGSIEYVNPVFCELTGYERDEVIGENPRILKSGLVAPEDYDEMWRSITSGQVWRGELINQKKSGEHYFELATIAPIVDARGEITHFVGVKQDITEKKRYEQELIDAREKARESDILKAAFLQNMSHEIRTPMNAILGFSELAKMPSTSEEKRSSYLSIVIDSTHRLLNVVDDIVDISRLETGNLVLKSNSVKLKNFMLGLYEDYKNETGSEVVMRPPEIDKTLQSATILIDSARLRQVMEKLISNAVKFTRRGEIRLGCHKVGGAVRFYVEDTGIGIQPDMYNLIFQPFYQLDMGATRSFGGNGLGLTIASRIVEKMGGEIQVDSTPAKGSVFYFDTWPDNAGELEGLSESEEKLFHEKEHREFNILVAEDDEVNFILLREILKREFGEGTVKVIRATTGYEAIEIFREQENIDLVLMDVKMPDVDGVTATRQIKTINPDVPVIAQTALAMTSDRDEMIKAGCEGYLTKPIRRGLLIDTISRFLGVEHR